LDNGETMNEEEGRRLTEWNWCFRSHVANRELAHGFNTNKTKNINKYQESTQKYQEIPSKKKWRVK